MDELAQCCPNATDNELRKAEAALIQEKPLNLLTQKYLSIKAKEAGTPIQKLELNQPQQLLFNVLAPKIQEAKPIRILILKARQEGCSTEIEAIIYALTSQIPNINSLIIADISEHTNNLFEMSKLYQERLRAEKPHLVPVLKKSNEKKLEFEGIHSQIIVASAENTMAATSHTFQLVHVSEGSKFRDLNTLMHDLAQSVPKSGLSLIVIETTANGMEAFYNMWVDAIAGKTDWVPIFLAWFLLVEYAMPLENGQLYPLDGVKFTANSTRQAFLVEEKKLQEKENLALEQLNWRRWSIVNDCGGDLKTFKQENPANWQEAFQMSGSNFFDSEGMERQKVRIPKDIGEIFEMDLKYEFRALPEGRIKLYEYPAKGEQYIVTADASEALGQDEGSALVRNKRTNATCAVANGQYAPEELAHLCIMLGNYFNIAEIAPENKGYGYMLCQLIYAKYGKIYKRIVTKDGEKDEREELGFNTNSVTRPEYLARLAEEIKLSSTDLRDKDLINQCNTFIIDPKTKKPQAGLNNQDGLVICAGIASQVRHLHPYKPRMDAIDAKKRRRYHEIVETKNGGFGFE